jgi:hypothetical protein
VRLSRIEPGLSSTQPRRVWFQILGADNHIRVNPQLDQTFSMDDCSAIPAMLAATERFMETDTWRLQSALINKLFGSAG